MIQNFVKELKEDERIKKEEERLAAIKIQKC
jgi:hypothetical protein